LVLGGAAAVFLIAAIVLCWNLGGRYLWQDEAETALLAQRMTATGKPVAWDGRNLLTADFFRRDLESAVPTGSAEAAVRFWGEHGDYREDTAWILNPWGPYVVVAPFLKMLGGTTEAARLPFALSGALTAALLYAVVRRRLGSPLMGAMASILLLTNAFWILHMRQCRYYALSSLFLLATLEAYLRWREGRRWSGILFVCIGWCYFQCDYGSVWPVMLVLGADSLLRNPRGIRRALGLFAAFALSVLPFIFYYRLLGRASQSSPNPLAAFAGFLFEINLFQLPLILIPAAGFLVWKSARGGNGKATLPPILTLSLLILAALTLWMSVVGAFSFYRYIVAASSLSALMVAWVLVRGAEWSGEKLGFPRLAPLAAWIFLLLFVTTNLFSRPGLLLVPRVAWIPTYLASVFRPENRFLLEDLFGQNGDDPNKVAVEFLRSHLRPGEEVLCNYEDHTLMFYLPDTRIRGGIGAFRVTDSGNPRFAVYRLGAEFFNYSAIYRKELAKGVWSEHPTQGLDIPWANCPDPRMHHIRLAESCPKSPLVILERVSGP
jgi:hypothetical protein